VVVTIKAKFIGHLHGLSISHVFTLILTGTLPLCLNTPSGRCMGAVEVQMDAFLTSAIDAVE
jgi:hypothetical protein